MQLLLCVFYRRLTYESHSILPALAFSLDMFEKTHMSYGVNEVLLASVLGAVVFSFLAAQPLVIVGVTGESPTQIDMREKGEREFVSNRIPGPITVFNYTVYDIITPRGTNYLAFMGWICMCVNHNMP